jgi:phosphopantetheine adenylyltransferase
VASKLIREIARYQGDITSMVPPGVAKLLAEKYADGDTSGGEDGR